MGIYKPTELICFLEKFGLKPKKGLSQNFLIDGNIIRKIIKEAKIQKDSLILEIGPGPGALTQALLEEKASVIAIEKDQNLAVALERLQTPDKRLQIFSEDFLEFNLEEKLAPFIQEGKKITVVANLPYNITTPILIKLLPARKFFSSIFVMVQEEVAQRFVAVPKTKEYSSFTIFIRFFAIPAYLFFVSKNCFFPAPKVDSAVLELKLHKPPSVENQAAFFTMTRTAFEHRRKMLRSSLKDLYAPQQITKALEQMGKRAETRPEELFLEEFLHLFSLLNVHLPLKKPE